MENERLAMATKYERLADYLRSNFIEGVSGRNPLPSVSAIMRTRKVSQATVDRALGILEAEGLISREPGIGCFTADMIHADDPLACEVQQAGQVAKPIIHLAVCGLSGDSHPMWEKLVAAYRQTSPECDVQIVYTEPNRSSWSSITEDGALIDLLYCPPGAIEAAIDEDLLLDLSEQDMLSSELRQFASLGLTRKQQKHVIPYSFTARVVLFAQKRMSELGIDFSDGWDWSDFEKLCVRLRSEAPGKKPFLLLDEYASFCRRWTGPLVDDASHEVLFRGESAIQTIEVLRHLYQDMHAFPLCSELNLPGIVKVLQSPYPALCIGRTPWKTRLERMGVESLGMWPLPNTQIGHPTATLVNYLGVYRFSRYPELAASFIDFVCQPHGQELIQSSGQEFPLYATTGEAMLPRFAPAAALKVESQKKTPSDTKVPQDVMHVFQTTILNHEIERCLRGMSSVCECVERIHRRGTTLIRNSIKHHEFVKVRTRSVKASA